MRRGLSYLHLFLIMTVGSEDVSCAWRLPLGCWKEKKAWVNPAFTIYLLSSVKRLRAGSQLLLLPCSIPANGPQHPSPKPPTLAPLWTRQALWSCKCRLFCLECSLHLHRHGILLFQDNPSLVEPSVSFFLLLTRGSDWHPLESCMCPRLVFSLLMVIVCLSIFPTRMLIP